MERESSFQSEFVKKVKAIFGPDCEIYKNDSRYIQGIPDWTFIYKDLHGILEIKRSKHEKYQPNQEHYLDKHGKHGFTATVYPENEAYILKEMIDYFIHRNKKYGRRF